MRRQRRSRRRYRRHTADDGQVWFVLMMAGFICIVLGEPTAALLLFSVSALFA